MFQPTHVWRDIPVMQSGRSFVQADGTRLHNRAVPMVIKVEAQDTIRVIHLKPMELMLALQAANPYPGPGVMSGYAADPNGNSATLIGPNKVRLSVHKREGGDKRYIIELPETIPILAEVVEE